MSPNESSTSKDVQMARELGEVKGQLTHIVQLIQGSTESTNARIDAAHKATNQRIDDHQASNVARMDSHEKRIGTLEQNERQTAIKAAVAGAASGAVAGVMSQVAAALFRWKTGG